MNRRWTATLPRMLALALLCPTLASLGCSDSATAKISGKVSHNGKPVTGGTLIFGPVPSGSDQTPGRPVAVEIQPDGTYSTTKGAVVGKCTVTFNAPTVALPEGKVPTSKEPAPLSPYVGLSPKPKEVEVKPGDNTQDFELGR